MTPSTSAFGFRNEGTRGVPQELQSLAQRVFAECPLTERYSRENRYVYVAKWQPAGIETEAGISEIELREPRSGENKRIQGYVSMIISDGKTTFRCSVEIPKGAIGKRDVVVDRVKQSWTRIKRDLRREEEAQEPPVPKPIPAPSRPQPSGGTLPAERKKLVGFAAEVFGDAPDLIELIREKLAENIGADGTISSAVVNDIVRAELKLQDRSKRETAGIVRTLAGTLGVLRAVRTTSGNPKLTFYEVLPSGAEPVRRQRREAAAKTSTPGHVAPAVAVEREATKSTVFGRAETEISQALSRLKAFRDEVTTKLEKSRQDLQNSEEGLAEVDKRIQAVVGKTDDEAALGELIEASRIKRELLQDKSRIELRQRVDHLTSEADTLNKFFNALKAGGYEESTTT